MTFIPGKVLNAADLNAALANYAPIAALAATAVGQGASLVGMTNGDTVQTFLTKLMGATGADIIGVSGGGSVQAYLNMLLSSTGATAIGYGSGTVKAALDATAVSIADLGSRASFLSTYPSALPNEVLQITGGGGTGGTPGTYVGGVTGAFPGFQWSVFVGSDGKAIPQIDSPGISTSSTPPTLVMPTIAGLTGATTPVATVGTIPVNRMFMSPSADGSQRVGWINSAGSLSPYLMAGVQYAEYLKGGIDGVFSAASTAVNELGRGLILPNRFDLNRATAGQAVNTDGSVITSAANTVSDLIPVIAGAAYVFARRPGQWAFYNSAGTYIAGSYATPSSGGIFTGSISGSTLTISATTTGSLATGMPVDAPGGGGGVEIQSGTGPYTLNKSFASAVPAGSTIYGGVKVTAPAGAAFIRFSQATANTDLARQGLYAGSALPGVYTAAAFRDPAADTREALDQAIGTIRRSMGTSRSLLDTSATTDGQALAANGTLYSAAGFLVTPFIQTNATDQFITNFSSGSNGAVWYDEAQRAMMSFTITSGSAFGPPPAGARFWRSQSSALATKTTLRVYAATALPSGLPGFPALDPAVQARTAITQARAAIDASQAGPRQLFNKDDTLILTDTALANNGSTYAASGFGVTGFTEVTGGVPHLSNYGSPSGQVCYYDENFAIINSGTNYAITANTPFTPPSGAYRMRRSVASFSTRRSDMYVYRAAFATGRVFFGSNPTAGDTLTINSVVITFVASGATGNQVNIGADSGATSTALQTFVNANSVALACTAAVGGSANTTVLTSNSVGPGGNTITLSRTGTAMTLTAFSGALPTSTAYKPFGGGSVPVPGLRIGFIGNSQTDNGFFQSEVIRITNGTEAFRSGNPGRDIGYLADTVIPTLTASIAASDVIFFQEGHNEWNGAARALGSISDSSSANTTYGKLKKAFDAIYTANASVELFVGGPSYAVISGTADTTANARGVTGAQIDDAMRAVAQLYGAPFVEIRRQSNINAATLSVNSGDGLHWNLTSGPRIGRMIGGVMNGNV